VRLNRLGVAPSSRKADFSLVQEMSTVGFQSRHFSIWEVAGRLLVNGSHDLFTYMRQIQGGIYPWQTRRLFFQYLQEHSSRHRFSWPKMLKRHHTRSKAGIHYGRSRINMTRPFPS